MFATATKEVWTFLHVIVASKDDTNMIKLELMGLPLKTKGVRDRKTIKTTKDKWLVLEEKILLALIVTLEHCEDNFFALLMAPNTQKGFL